MDDTLIGNLHSDQGDSKEPIHIVYCEVCHARLSPKGMFCPECDPPLPPGDEPEETGTTFQQALLRICALVFLFLGVAFVKLDISLDGLFSDKLAKGELEMLNENDRPHDMDFQTVHTVIPPLANIRSKPSMNGKVVTVAEQGMRLEVEEDNGRWSKVRIFGKTGWIANKLIKTEVQMQE